MPTETKEPQLTLIAYSKEKFFSGKVSNIADALKIKGYDVIWVNADTFEAIPEMAETFDLHGGPLKALKRTRIGARVFTFPGYLSLILHQVYETENGLKRERIAILLKDNLIVTLQERPGDVFNPIRESIREGEGLFRERGADYLLFALLEAIVENYVPIIERISSKMEELEAQILSKDKVDTLRRIHGLRRETLFMRRTVFPLLEAFRKLELEGGEFFTDETRIYLKELHEHVKEVLDILEGQRELVQSLVELYYSTISTKTNEVIRILTVVSTIFIPLTFITGLYGMNFRYMPELYWKYGYPVVLFLMLAIALGMLAYFRRKGWI